MGKYDNITKDYLYDLYITKNLSKPEIKKITGIPLTSLGRLLDRFCIIKSTELLKQMQSRIVLDVYMNRTEEARLEKIDKLRKKWENKTQEEKEKTINNLKRINSNRTSEHQRKLIESNKKFYENESEEHRKERVEKNRKARLEYNKIESKEHKESRYKKLKETVANWTEEKREKVSYKHREGFYKRTQDQISESYKKTMDTRRKNGSLFVSNFEKEVGDFVRSLGFSTRKYTIGYKENRFEIDILIDEKKIGIECNGCYYHSQNGVNKYSKNYHFNKKKMAEEQGIDLIYIWEDQWLHKQNIVKDIIRARLGIYEKRIYARNCIVKQVDVSVYKQFCNDTHIQGYRSAKIRLGLYYKDKLVQIASFNPVRNIGRQNSKEQWEWVRGCLVSNNSVIGGTSKLFSYFIKHYDPESVLCYADWNLFNGDGYRKSGFEFTGFTGPDLFYVKNSSIERVSRNPYKHKEYKQLIEKGRMLKCYGAGSLRFVWKKQI